MYIYIYIIGEKGWGERCVGGGTGFEGRGGNGLRSRGRNVLRSMGGNCFGDGGVLWYWLGCALASTGSCDETQRNRSNIFF